MFLGPEHKSNFTAKIFHSFTAPEDCVADAKAAFRQAIKYAPFYVIFCDYVAELIKAGLSEDDARAWFDRCTEQTPLSFSLAMLREIQALNPVTPYPISLLSLNNHPGIDDPLTALNVALDPISRLKCLHTLEHQLFRRLSQHDNLTAAVKCHQAVGAASELPDAARAVLQNVLTQYQQPPQGNLSEDDARLAPRPTDKVQVTNRDSINQALLDQLVDGTYQEPGRQREINLSFAASMLFESGTLARHYREDGLQAYTRRLRRMERRGETLNLSRHFDLFGLLQGARNLLSEQVLPLKLGMISQNQPGDAKLFASSLWRHGIKLDFASYCPGQREQQCANFGVDVAFCDKTKTEYKMGVYGVAAFNVSKHPDTIKALSGNGEPPTLGQVLGFLLKVVPDDECRDIVERSLYQASDAALLDHPVTSARQQRDPLPPLRGRNPNASLTGEVNILLDPSLLYVDQGPSHVFPLACNLLRLKQAVEDSEYAVNLWLLDSEGMDTQWSRYLLEHGAQICRTLNQPPSPCDLLIHSDFQTVRNWIDQGMGAIHLLPRRTSAIEQVQLSEPVLNIVSDLDECLTQGDEQYYQRYNLTRFKAIQESRMDENLETSIIYPLFAKLGKIARHLKLNPSADIELNLDILTARGGDEGSMRVMQLIDHHGIYLDATFFLDGRNKNTHLKYLASKGGSTLFIDDHPTHIQRVLDDDILVVSGHCIHGINNSDELDPAQRRTPD